mgnify:CR=1 FL=1
MPTATRAALALMALAASLLAATVAEAQTARRPLPVAEDRPTVFRRVLTRPAATLHGAASGGVTEQLSPFEPFYVYGEDGDWLEVGRSMTRGPEGWVGVEAVVPWRQNIVAAFKRPDGRERTLFFDSRESLEYVIHH